MVSPGLRVLLSGTKKHWLTWVFRQISASLGVVRSCLLRVNERHRFCDLPQRRSFTFHGFSQCPWLPRGCTAVWMTFYPLTCMMIISSSHLYYAHHVKNATAA